MNGAGLADNTPVIDPLTIILIFVFGSNELGIHGGGAAKVAHDKHGAIRGQGFGPQGQSFGIPTCSKPTGQPGFEISHEKLAYYVACFLAYAKIIGRARPNIQFQITKIGCGLAGWKNEEVAPLFVNAPDNCQFDTEWKPWLGDKTISGADRTYWGHVA
jgi:hypothetical protein